MTGNRELQSVCLTIKELELKASGSKAMRHEPSERALTLKKDRKLGGTSCQNLWKGPRSDGVDCLPDCEKNVSQAVMKKRVGSPEKGRRLGKKNKT